MDSIVIIHSSNIHSSTMYIKTFVLFLEACPAIEPIPEGYHA